MPAAARRPAERGGVAAVEAGMAEPVDPERPRDQQPFDRPDGYSGQGYTIGREVAIGAADADPRFAARVTDADLPPDAGHRAVVDPATGAVHGSGASIGGGNPGEDFGSYSPSGDTYPLTGGEGTDHTPGSLGPPRERTPPD
jgi:hypothetical protein